MVKMKVIKYLPNVRGMVYPHDLIAECENESCKQLHMRRNEDDTFARAIFSVLQHMDILDKNVARDIGMSPSYFSAIRHGKIPNPERTVRIAEKCNLFYGDLASKAINDLVSRYRAQLEKKYGMQDNNDDESEEI